MRVNKVVSLEKLERELAAAGVPVNGLSMTGEGPFEIVTHDGTGVLVELPGSAQPVIEAHHPDPVVDPQAELEAAIGGIDTAGIASASTVAELRAETLKAVNGLKAALLGQAGRKGQVAGRR